MVSCSFEGENCIMQPPEGMTSDDCEVLSAAIGQLSDGSPVIVSCWKLTKEELEEYTKTGRIWLVVMGSSMPPVIVTAIKPLMGEIDEERS